MFLLLFGVPLYILVVEDAPKHCSIFFKAPMLLCFLGFAQGFFRVPGLCLRVF